MLRSILRGMKLLWLLLAAAVGFALRRPKTALEGAMRIHQLCRKIVAMLRIECRVSGEVPQDGAVVSNHLSYLDVVVMNAVRPFVMVAKSEVRRWPLLGGLTTQAGTVYVTRGGGPTTYPAVNAAMAAAYRSGLPALFFPEGTTTNGSEVLAFRRGLFHSVLNERVALRTAALRYSVEHGSVEEDICWWGEMGLVPHLLRFLQLRDVQVELQFGTEVRDREDRFVLAVAAREQVLEMYEGSAREAELVEAL
ncbi:1-acyl-sn-glycerol-3-phosphate acyltransferase [Granulicella sp. dw_53]|uniref:1-acyl-sn-glycerol-3-phosphate acyltransferase n=1 Tax=Granulicella sp. dw_53 TaxID=2719792 RepID=UPI001BD5FBC7|nr:1-acyl-sn-glycerol-3-phosphate acyltransferase [Granulicella sp. dw_53]